MLSKYFEIKTNSKKFEENFLKLINETKDKKVLLYGAGQGFVELNKKYSLTDNLNIVAIADKKFEKNHVSEFLNKIKAIAPNDILNEEYDYILVTNEYTLPVMDFLRKNLGVPKENIKLVFNEEIKDEASNTNYLYKFKFEKTLPKLIKELKGKTVILYGAGPFLELILKNYDLSGLNILGVSDKRFYFHEENETWQGYKVFSPDELKELKPNYVLVSTKLYINIIESLYYDTLKDTNIKIKPLVKKPLFTLIKEIWS